LVQLTSTPTPPVPAVGAAPGVTSSGTDSCVGYNTAGSVRLNDARAATVSPPSATILL